MAAVDTREELLRRGMALLLQRGYHGLGIATLLEVTRIPKGSFYHYFGSKEAFGLEAIDYYMQEVHGALDHCLGDTKRPPLQRVRHFFERVEQKYRGEGYLGCLLGGLGQELSGVSEAFRRKVEECFSQIGARIAECLELAVARGELPKKTDTKRLARLLVNCWEGAALRSRMTREAAPLREMLDFYFQAAGK